MFKQSIALFFMVFGLTNSSLHSGMTVEVIVSDFEEPGLTDKRVTLYFEKGYIKIDDGNSFSVIYSLQDNNVISVNHNEKIYRVINKKAIDLLEKNQEELKTRMREAIIKTSPDKQAIMEASMHRQMDRWNFLRYSFVAKGPMDIRKTVRTENVERYRCAIYENYHGDNISKEYCIVPWDDVTINRDVRNLILGVGRFAEEILSKLKPISFVQSGFDYFSGVDKLAGFPVLVREFRNGHVIKESSIVNIAPSLFNHELSLYFQSYQKVEVNLY